MTQRGYRVEHDSMGELRIPADALWGAQTQRALQNFPLKGPRMPRPMIRALALIKEAAAAVNSELGLLDGDLAAAIRAAAEEVAAGRHEEHFPLDIFQTGSGTSTNMNVNEVIAHLASEHLPRAVHPNDHVNMGQSSNDVVPSAIHLAASLELDGALLPALRHLAATIDGRAAELDAVVKTGRTHLMDAMPIRLGQELSGWSAQIYAGCDRLEAVRPRLQALALGGTAIGTGINAHPELGRRVAGRLAERHAIPYTASNNYFESLSCQDTAVELSGQLRVLAVSLMKICNDLRWMNSGPLAGLGEIALPALQPGSSIMPGKVNPVIPEAVAMACAQVMGNDLSVTVGGQAGNFQLNVMLPVIAHNLLQSVQLLANGARVLADRAIAGFSVNEPVMRRALERNPIMVTALNPIIGYEKGAEIAKRAYAEGRAVKELAAEMTNLGPEQLERLLDPAALTEGGIRK